MVDVDLLSTLLTLLLILFVTPIIAGSDIIATELQHKIRLEGRGLIR
jgi:hypothetical protein